MQMTIAQFYINRRFDIKQRKNHYNCNKRMVVINCKACNELETINIPTITSILTAITKYEKQKIELTIYRKYAAPNRRVGPTL